jgi:hydrogenase expression/formation protein HypE
MISCPFPFDKYPMITMAHGGGGRFTQRLIDEIFQPIFGCDTGHDGARITLSGNVSVSTDSYVVRPIFFPGGNIGSLSVQGTCNDLAMCGARPRYLTCSFILEEGFPTESLYQVVSSMRKAADEIGVQIITGDTKVVEKQHGDGIYINTTGIGENLKGWDLSPHHIIPGDVIAVNGDLGRHGAAIMAKRDNLQLTTDIVSDCEHLYPQIKNLFDQNIHLHCLRDLTRGGLATALCEMAETRELEFRIEYEKIQVQANVQSLCDLLGLDPYYVANEGRFVAILPLEEAQKTNLQVIGRVTHRKAKDLVLDTGIGSKRILRKLSGEQLPRIC